MPINSTTNNTVIKLIHMRRNATIAVIIAIAILCFSITVTTQNNTVFPLPSNQADITQHFAAATPLVLGISSQQHTELNQTTRANIYTYVENNPGIHFRGICSGLSLSVGMVQYHTGILAGAGFLTVYSDGKMQRFFISKTYSNRKMQIISLLRHKTARSILKIISRRQAMSHGELASQLAISSQGLTWQMHNLKDQGVIQETSNGLKVTYFLNKTEMPLIEESIRLVK
jgi:predicted transcriptional regulator